MNAAIDKRRGLTLTQQILVGLLIGVAVGAFVNAYHHEWAPYFRPFSQLFLRLIKMIIAPLIFATLVAGIAGAGHLRQVGRIGLRALVYFEIVTTLALFIGLAAVNLTRPGDGIVLPPPGPHEVAAQPQRWDQILVHTVPESVINAMADGEVLQIVVFSIFFAIALEPVRREGPARSSRCARRLSETMFKFTNIVMHYAPFGVGAAIAYAVGHGGFGVLYNLAWLVATLYLALAGLIVLVFLPIALLFKVPLRKFVKAVREPASSPSRRLPARRRCRARWRSWNASACRGASWPSCCRSATASTSTAPRSTCRSPRCSSRKPPACS